MKKIVDESIDEKKKKLLEVVDNLSQKSGGRKEKILLPFLDEIKIMAEKKLSLNAQIKALSQVNIKVSYRTYKQFLIEQDIYKEASSAKLEVNKNLAMVKFILNNSGQVKPFSKKEDLKKLNFTFNQEAQKWMAPVQEIKAGEIEKQLQLLKIGYDKQ
jgi:hypothetical protein